LAAERCDQIQGFLTSKPVAAEQMLRLQSVNLQKRDRHGAGTERKLFSGDSEIGSIIQLGTMLREHSKFVRSGAESDVATGAALPNA